MKSQQISKISHIMLWPIVKEIRVDVNFADKIYLRQIW